MKPIPERYKGTQCEKCVQRYKRMYCRNNWCKFFGKEIKDSSLACAFRQDEKEVKFKNENTL